ncbi:cation:proton antiporter [Candidatus Finniella inopinata]|uniref:Cation:proton antiporter n=1 Tax=Candidatus Finniella inopinata TaxID=1696036 RepID=A0A4Q7DFF1_9PROT|nr:cation:proton antiporter [Candidatus Finniella inopinata]RZI45501.1 cation:proton antiporter [Candidatus Finniella inopinata]
MEENSLTEVAMVVVAALAGGLGFVRLKQPPIIGYILTGILLGPSGLAFIQSRDQVSVLAELGVLLLLFVVGMELNLRTFKKVWVVATLCTILQVVSSIAITVAISGFFGWSAGLSLLLGFVASISSTAVVVKVMESIGELKTEIGQLTIGILIAQDLAIVPMILILRSYGESWFSPSLFLKLIASVGMIAALITYLSRRQRVRLPLTQMIAGDRDLTPLASLTFCFAAAAISGLIGLSAPYGAFLAGLILGNTHERLAMIESTKPIQSILLMVFFLSIGLLLDLEFIWENFAIVLKLLFVVTVGKTALNVGILRLLRLPWPQAFLIGVVLAQLGEFAFLMATISHETNIINEDGQRLIVGLTVLSLAFSPFWLAIAKHFQDSAAQSSSGLQGVLGFFDNEKFSKIRHELKHFRKSFRFKGQQHREKHYPLKAEVALDPDKLPAPHQPDDSA